MQRWIQRAQRKADERDARYRRHEAGMRAGQIPPGLMDGLIAHQQAVNDRRDASYTALLSQGRQLSALCDNDNLMIRGPDGVAVYLVFQKGPIYHVPLPGPSSRWRTRRRFAAVGYYASVPYRFLMFRRSCVAWAYTMSEPPASVSRQFPDFFEAESYFIDLARRIRAEGVKALRQETGQADAGQT